MYNFMVLMCVFLFLPIGALLYTLGAGTTARRLQQLVALAALAWSQRRLRPSGR